MIFISLLFSLIVSIFSIATFLLFKMMRTVLPSLYRLHYFCQVFALFMYKHSQKENLSVTISSLGSDDIGLSSNKSYDYFNNSTYNSSNYRDDDFSRRLTDPSYSYLSYNIHHNTHYGNF